RARFARTGLRLGSASRSGRIKFRFGETSAATLRPATAALAATPAVAVVATIPTIAALVIAPLIVPALFARNRRRSRARRRSRNRFHNSGSDNVGGRNFNRLRGFGRRLRQRRRHHARRWPFHLLENLLLDAGHNLVVLFVVFEE